MIFIILLLAANYKNNIALQESSLNRFQLDGANKAATLEYFFLERKYDINNLADSQEIQNYFNNRAMGMSEEYGLKISLFSISQVMRKTLQEKNIDDQPIYNRIIFINDDTKLLASSETFQPLKKTVTISWEKQSQTISEEPQLIIEKTSNGHEIVFVAACHYKKKICGWLLATLNIETLYNHFLSPETTLSSKAFNLTLTDGTALKVLTDRQINFPWKQHKDTIAQTTHPRRITVHEGEKVHKMLLMRVPINPFPLYLTGYVLEREIFGSINTGQFLAGAAAMVFILLFGLIWSITTNIRHLVLKTRFDESTKQRNTLTEKNIQLRKEINKRKTAEKYLIENEERYRKLFEFSSDAILIMKGSSILACNQKTAELFKVSREKILKQNLYNFCPEKQSNGKQSKTECLNKIKTALLTPQYFEWTLQTADQSLIAAEIAMTAIHLKSDTLLQVLIRDITEKKHTQEILVQTEKMMAVGGLAAGMAHEINNPLGIILQSCQMVLRQLRPDLKKNKAIADALGFDLEKMQNYLQQRGILRYLESIHSAGERAANIVKSMLDFGRSSKNSGLELCNINEILDQTLSLAASDYTLKQTYDFKKITITKNYGDIDAIYCAKTEIGQVLLNIIKNAAQALGPMTLTEQEPEIILTTTPQQNGLEITIADNGPGISKKVQQSIFEPFFTTKPVGEGTGLGLSVSYYIITSHHNGQISVESEPGKGTTFTIQLPANRESSLPPRSSEKGE